MTGEQYDELLEDIRDAKENLAHHLAEAVDWEQVLATLLNQLDREDTRIAWQALPHGPLASRKLVIGE